MIKIGIIREEKIPEDKRVPLTPGQAAEAKTKYHVEIVCQRSDIRCFTDHEYTEAGIDLVDSVDDCDILIGVKEVPKKNLIPNKRYFFFSHTTKEQPYNRELLQTILEKQIEMIDYEGLTDENGQRVIAFGRYAGIVGAYNAIWTFGERYNLFHLRRAKDCFDLEDLKTEYSKVKLPAINIVVTGGGRVAKGAMEVLYGMGIKKITPENFVSRNYGIPVFTQLNSRDYNRRIDHSVFSRIDFYKNGEAYESDFSKYAENADILISAGFWHPSAPRLFTIEEMNGRNFGIKVIADITCDIEGSIPSTKKPSTIDDPVYDFNPSDNKLDPPFVDEGNISVMAVDNLPNELPRNASHDFGMEFLNRIIPALKEEENPMITRATITKNGSLTEPYKYLQNFVDNR